MCLLPENSVSLRIKIALIEAKLPAAVPEVEHEVPEEPHVRMLHVECGAEPHRVSGHVISEDDATHRRLACAALAHQQDLLLAHSAACLQIAAATLRLAADAAALPLTAAPTWS